MKDIDERKVSGANMKKKKGGEGIDEKEQICKI